MRWLCWWRPPCVLRRVVVNVTYSPTEAFEGVLWAYWWGWLTLKDVTAIKTNHPPEKLPAEVVLHRSQIAFIQVLP